MAYKLCQRSLLTFLLTLLVAERLCHAFNLLDPDHEEPDDYTDDSDDEYDEDDDEELILDEDENEDHWKTAPNATANELDILTRIADYLTNAHYLLEYDVLNKEKRHAEAVLENAWSPVKRDAKILATAAPVLPGNIKHIISCAAAAESKARSTLHHLQDDLAKCFKKAEATYDPPLSADGDDEDDTASLELEAEEFLTLAMSMMRATPLLDAVEVVDLVLHHPLGLTLLEHAVMLQQRSRRRRERVQRCLDLNMEEAYKHVDAAREKIAACVLIMEKQDEL